MLKTFKIGGIHPAENKLSANKATTVLPLSKTVTIMVAQHIGAPSKIIVARGDTVKVGQIIAQSAGFVSTNIHSSVSGKVAKIDTVVDSSGYKKNAVVINVEGDEWLESIDRSTDLVTNTNLDAKAITDRILNAGIVGLGGATFPTHVKLMPPPGTKAEVLLINGVECEPYLTADHRLMLERGDELMVGIKILKKALNVNRAVIGIENNKPDAIKHLSDLVKKYDGIEICPLKVQYPQGGEKQLIKAVTGREVPAGALPIAVGAVVNNVGTALATYEAVIKNKPLIERIGTPISELIEAAGGLPDDTAKIVSGGPMMGKAVANVSVPVTKGTSGVLLIREDEGHRKPIKNCIRCGRCVTACPMGLEPYLLMTLSEKKIWERSESERVMDCIECGSCSYSCPANRPLLDHIRYSKLTVGGIIRSRKS